MPSYTYYKLQTTGASRELRWSHIHQRVEYYNTLNREWLLSNMYTSLADLRVANYIYDRDE